MLLWFGKKTQTKTVKGGRVHRAQCPSCNEVTRFVECEVTKTFTAYHFIDLTDSTETLFKCSECLELFEIDIKPDPIAQAKLHRLQERKARLQAAIRKKQDAAMMAKRKRAVESDLAKLKRKMR